MTIDDLMKRHVIHTPQISNGGTLVDTNGRVICTMNLEKDGLTISEAFLYAELFIQACTYPQELINLAKERTKSEQS